MLADKHYDAIEDSVGKFGLWQLWISIIIIISRFPTSLYQGSILYLYPRLDYSCLDPVVTDINKVCDIDCNKYEFDRSVFKDTIGTEFELICDRKYLGAAAHTIFMVGNGFGNMLAGVLADKYGRKWIFFSYVVLHFLAVVAIVLAPNLIFFLIFRFISGFGIGGLGIGFVILLETIGEYYREIMSCMYLLTFPLGLMSLSVLAYFLRSWRTLYSVLSLFSLGIVALTFLLPESARYLLVEKEIDKCVAVLEKGAKQNRLPTDKIRENVERGAEAIRQANRKGSIGILVVYKFILMRILICAYTFFTSGFLFFGILQYVGQLNDDLFVSNFFGALTGIPGLFTCMLLTKFCPRKIILILSSLVIALGMIIVIEFGKSKVSVAAAGICLYALSILVPTVTIFIGEHFPTPVRSTAVGICFASHNFGTALSSFSSFLADYKIWLPPLIFAILQVISILLLLFIPESKSHQLPETIEDVLEEENNTKKF